MFGLKKIKNNILRNSINLTGDAAPDDGFKKLVTQLSSNKTIPDAELYSFAFSCINALAEIAAKTNIYLYRESGKTDVEVTEHEFLRFKKTPNIYKQTLKHLIHFITANVYLFGNCYIYKLRNPKNSSVLQLIPCLTKGVRIVENQTLGIISHYEYTYNGMVRKIEVNDMLHFKEPNPINLLTGKPVIDVLKNIIDIDYLQMQYLKNFYTHDATPHTVLETDSDLDKTYINELEAKWIDKFRGIFNRFQPIILKNGLKLSKMQSTPAEVKAVEQQKLVQEKILSNLRMPKILMSVTENMNYATAAAALKIFVELVIAPFIELVIEPVLNEMIQNEYNDSKLICKFDYTTSYDKETQLKIIDTLARHKAITKNEIRQSEGYTKVNDTRADTIFEEDKNQNNSKNDPNK